VAINLLIIEEDTVSHARTARLATKALPQQGLVCGTVCHRIYATKNSVFGASGRRLQKTYWFTADHSAVWTIIYCAIEIHLLTYLLHDAQLLLNKQQQIWGGVYVHIHFSSSADTIVLPDY